MNEAKESCLAKAVRSGALFRYAVQLEKGEHEIRRLWLRPEVMNVLSPGVLEQDQFDRVTAALRRFVVGGQFNVVSKDCAHPGTQKLADIRELKTEPPPFVEVRFKPPKHDLRLFGRFTGKDGLVLTSKGLKSLTEVTNSRPLNVADELRRCNDFFVGQQFDPDWYPQKIVESISNVKII